MIKVEYLLPFNTEDGQCKNVNAFNSLLTSNADFSATKTKIKFKNSEYGYKVEMTEIKDKNCSVFHVVFDATKLTEKFREMLRVFRKTVNPHIQDNMQVIWDGVSYEWSKELYPLIYEVENTMRKLISKFMLIKLGIGWHKSSVPKDVEKSIKTPSYKPSHGILYEVDFIQLSNFLFEPYPLKEISKLPSVLTEILKNGLTEKKKEEIKDYIPTSNWDRYFSDLVDCESEELKKKWEKLYDIRIKIAHNKSMTIDDVNNAKELHKTTSEILTKALNKVGSIEIPESEKESVSLHTIARVSEPIKEYISKYFTFNEGLNNVILNNSDKFSFDINTNSPISSLLKSSESGNIIFSDNLKSNLFTIEDQKNSILSGYIPSNSIVLNNSDYIFKDTASEFITSFKLKDDASHFVNLFPKSDKDDDK